MAAINTEKIKKAETKLSGTRALTYCALFAALTAVLSQVSFYVGVIPISLGLLGVLLCGGLLGCRLGTFAVLAYITMGLLGLPVFAGFRSSAAILGPTGGYIAGYVFSAFLAGLAGRFAKTGRREQKNPSNSLAAGVFCKAALFGILCLSVLVCYLFGTAWYCFYAKTTFLGALSVCVFPFLPADAAKVVVGGLLIIRLKPFVR